MSNFVFRFNRKSRSADDNAADDKSKDRKQVVVVAVHVCVYVVWFVFAFAFFMLCFWSFYSIMGLFLTVLFFRFSAVLVLIFVYICSHKRLKGKNPLLRHISLPLPINLLSPLFIIRFFYFFQSCRKFDGGEHQSEAIISYRFIRINCSLLFDHSIVRTADCSLLSQSPITVLY